MEIINLSKIGQPPAVGDLCVFIYSRNQQGQPIATETRIFTEKDNV